MPFTRGDGLRKRAGINPEDRNAVVSPRKSGEGVVVRWVLPPASTPSRRKSRVPLLSIRPNLPVKKLDLHGPQSPLTPIPGEEQLPPQGGLPAIPPSPSPVLTTQPTLIEDDLESQLSLPTLPTLTDTSFGGSLAMHVPRTPTPQGTFRAGSVLHTPRKPPHPRPLIRSPAMAQVAYWRQGISGIEEADIRFNENGEVGCIVSQEEADQAGSSGGVISDPGIFVASGGSRQGNEGRQLAQLLIQRNEQRYTEMMESQESGRITFDRRSVIGLPFQVDGDNMDMDDPRQSINRATLESESGVKSESTDPASLDGVQDCVMRDDTSESSSSRASPDDVGFQLAMEGEESEDPTVLLPRDDFIYQRVRAYDPNGRPLVDPETGAAVFVHVAKRLESIDRSGQKKFGPEGTLLSVQGYQAPDRTAATTLATEAGPSQGGQHITDPDDRRRRL